MVRVLKNISLANISFKIYFNLNEIIKTMIAIGSPGMIGLIYQLFV